MSRSKIEAVRDFCFRLFIGSEDDGETNLYQIEDLGKHL